MSKCSAGLEKKCTVWDCQYFNNCLHPQRPIAPEPQSENAIHNAAVEVCVGTIKKCLIYKKVKMSEGYYKPHDLIAIDEAIAALEAVKK